MLVKAAETITAIRLGDRAMSRTCQLTGKKAITGHRVSHSNVKTKHRFLPNIQSKRFWSEKNSKFVRLRVSTAVMRTIDKIGFDEYLRRNQISVKGLQNG